MSISIAIEINQVKLIKLKELDLTKMLELKSIKNYEDHNQLMSELVDMHDEQSKKFTTVLAEKDTSLEALKTLIFAARVFADVNLVLFGEIRKLRKIIENNDNRFNDLQSEYSKGV